MSGPQPKFRRLNKNEEETWEIREFEAILGASSVREKVGNRREATSVCSYPRLPVLTYKEFLSTHTVFSVRKKH